MIKFRDVEHNEIITIDELEAEYKELYANGETEAETFSDYIENCMTYNNGCLENMSDLGFDYKNEIVTLGEVLERNGKVREFCECEVVDTEGNYQDFWEVHDRRRNARVLSVDYQGSTIPTITIEI